MYSVIFLLVSSMLASNDVGDYKINDILVQWLWWWKHQRGGVIIVQRAWGLVSPQLPHPPSWKCPCLYIFSYLYMYYVSTHLLFYVCWFWNIMEWKIQILCQISTLLKMMFDFNDVHLFFYMDFCASKVFHNGPSQDSAAITLVTCMSLFMVIRCSNFNKSIWCISYKENQKP